MVLCQQIEVKQAVEASKFKTAISMELLGQVWWTATLNYTAAPLPSPHQGWRKWEKFGLCIARVQNHIDDENRVKNEN